MVFIFIMFCGTVHRIARHKKFNTNSKELAIFRVRYTENVHSSVLQKCQNLKNLESTDKTFQLLGPATSKQVWNKFQEMFDRNFNQGIPPRNPIKKSHQGIPPRNSTKEPHQGIPSRNPTKESHQGIPPRNPTKESHQGIPPPNPIKQSH